MLVADTVRAFKISTANTTRTRGQLLHEGRIEEITTEGRDSDYRDMADTLRFEIVTPQAIAFEDVHMVTFPPPRGRSACIPSTSG